LGKITVPDTSPLLRRSDLQMCAHVLKSAVAAQLPTAQPVYLSAASHCTPAAAAAAVACRYTEGVSDLQGSSISLARPPQLLWGDVSSGSEAGAAAQTWVNTLQVDRGVSFEVSCLRLPFRNH
jgi:hypothetical protein